MPSISDFENGLYEAMNEATVQSRGTVTAPTAGTDITSVSLDPGVWEITAYARLGLGGVPAAADNDNMRLFNATDATSVLVLPVIATQNSVPVPMTVKVSIDATKSFVIEAVASGTASVVYCAYLVCRKVSDELS